MNSLFEINDSHTEHIVCSELLSDTYPEIQAAARETLLFKYPKPLARVAKAYNPALLSPGSSLAVITNGADEAGYAVMIAVAASCAKQGASVLLLSRTTDKQKAAEWLYKMGPGLLREDSLTRVDVKFLDRLDFSILTVNPSEKLTEDCIIGAVKDADADLIILEDATSQELDVCSKISKGTGVPLLYNLTAKRGRKRMVCKSIKSLPSYILLMDRSFTEDEAEKPNRPGWMFRDCRLLVPDVQNRRMDLSFEGMFTLYYSEGRKLLLDIDDEYDGHLLWSQLDRLDFGKDQYVVVEPPDYEERLRSINDWG